MTHACIQTFSVLAQRITGGQGDDEELEEDHQCGCDWSVRDYCQPPAVHVRAPRALLHALPALLCSGYRMQCYLWFANAGKFLLCFYW
jgi:hypothetical protein